MAWDGDAYQERFDQLASGGSDVHGEAQLVRRHVPRSVLDAGCGTGRVAIELADHGIEVVGVDVDPSMLETARRRAPGIEWVHADLAVLDLGRRFDVVVMAGNVVLFTDPGTEGAVVGSCARHLAPGATLLAGFQLDRSYGVADYDEHCAAAGLVLVDRWSTWSQEPYPGDGGYAVSAHRWPA
ncbi:MAG: class I SAM-dependent methyltransferase [Acidimicrobiales bacterium]